MPARKSRAWAERATARITRSWVFGGGVDGARGVLEAIAGGLITVTGVVFSVTIVALQLASTQFTPRVLRNFTADRGSQLVLGVFIGTLHRSRAGCARRTLKFGSSWIWLHAAHCRKTW